MTFSMCNDFIDVVLKSSNNVEDVTYNQNLHLHNVLQGEEEMTKDVEKLVTKCDGAFIENTSTDQNIF